MAWLLALGGLQVQQHGFLGALRDKGGGLVAQARHCGVQGVQGLAQVHGLLRSQACDAPPCDFVFDGVYQFVQQSHCVFPFILVFV